MWIKSYDHLAHQDMNRSLLKQFLICTCPNNDSVLIDNKYAKHIGYKPNDNGEDFRKKIEKDHGFVDSKDSLVTTHGGYFASAGHFDD